MRVVSTNVGKPQSYEFGGVTVQSSMRRQPTRDGLVIHFDHVEGDEFAVTKFHGIKEAVVYALASSTFVDFGRLYSQTITPGNFGENLTMDQLDESLFMIGDEYEIGTARLRVTGPRYPCNRLNFCFQRGDAMDLFTKHRRPGVYFEVVGEGRAAVGDELKRAFSAGGETSVLRLFDCLTLLRQFSAGVLNREEFLPVAAEVLNSPVIPEYHRAKFRNAAK